MPKYKRTQATLSYHEFLNAITGVKEFKSSEGKQYAVTDFNGNVLYFKRLDANPDILWNINLEHLYKAYNELKDFKTAYFSKYIPRCHSPGRGLLIKLGLLELC